MYIVSLYIGFRDMRFRADANRKSIGRICPVDSRFTIHDSRPHQIVVPHVEVLRDLARLQPDERRRHTLEQKSSDCLPLLGPQRSAIDTGDDEVKQVFLALELIPVPPYGPAERVWLDAHRLKGKLRAGFTHRRIERGKLDRAVRTSVLEDGAHHGGATIALSLGRFQQSKIQNQKPKIELAEWVGFEPTTRF
jgi:hypothetical protein